MDSTHRNPESEREGLSSLQADTIDANTSTKQVSERKKGFNRNRNLTNDFDSLAAASTIATHVVANKRLSLPMISKRKKAIRHYTSPSSPSSLENLATDTERKSFRYRTSFSSSEMKRKSSSAGNQVRRKDETLSRKKESEDNELDKDACSHNNTKKKKYRPAEIHVEKSSSLYKLFNRNPTEKNNDVLSGISPINDSKYYARSPEMHTPKDLMVQCSPKGKIRHRTIESPLLNLERSCQQKEVRQKKESISPSHFLNTPRGSDVSLVKFEEKTKDEYTTEKSPLFSLSLESEESNDHTQSTDNQSLNTLTVDRKFLEGGDNYNEDINFNVDTNVTASNGFREHGKDRWIGKAKSCSYEDFSELDEDSKLRHNSHVDDSTQRSIPIGNGSLSDVQGDVGSITTCDDSSELEDDVSTRWMKLSHMGHVSDYTGLKRKYDHFFPLHRGSIENIRDQIEKRLAENEPVAGESDLISQEDKIARLHNILAQQERLRINKLKMNSKFLPLSKRAKPLPVILLSSSDDFKTKSWSPPKNNVFEEVDASNLHPKISFEFFDEEDDVFVNSSEDETSKSKKRVNRSAQILSQKKSSISTLTEILHSIDFIRMYNSKSNEEYENNDKEDEHESEGNETNETEDSNIIHTGNSEKKCDHRKFSCNKSGGKVRDARGITKTKKPSIVLPAYKPFKATPLFAEYDELQIKFPYFHQLNEKSTVEIERILEQSSFLDEDAVSEEKNVARFIRGYSRKADQEKIEKRNFEEKQQNLAQEFEYYRKRKKKTPQEIEWKEMYSRPFCYDQPPKVCEMCNFEPNSGVVSLSVDREIQLFPGFKKIEISSPLDTINSVSPGNQIRLSTLKLFELCHSLAFIQRYNDGMIVSTQKRK